MSNKNFEDKVLKALWNIEKDVSWLKQDVARLDKKIDTVESNLNKKIDTVESNLEWKIRNVRTDLIIKIQWTEVRLNDKIDQQTSELKQTMTLHNSYLNQIFENIIRIDKERFVEKNNIRYA